MAYYNYHGIAKKLIFEGKLDGYEFCEDYHGIKPALVLYFKNHKPIPIRSYRWEEYISLIINFEDKP